MNKKSKRAVELSPAGKTFSLEELVEEVGRRLKELGITDGQLDRRVSAIVDIRTFRYYTTLGLVDRPLIEGREVRYHSRHVLQLLAIKALQASSMKLSEIQQRLYAKTDLELETILKAVSAEQPWRNKEGVRSVAWREWIIEPGFRIAIDEEWTPLLDDNERQQRIAFAITAFRKMKRMEK